MDYWRGELRAEKSFLRFATFVSLFPQLVAGPIERASTLLPQLAERPRLSVDRFASGAGLFLTGLFKKVALADYLALYVDEVFSLPERYGAASLVFATVFFAWQIYFDFSGYSDMARGIARAFGFELMLNFRRPYLARSLSEFWLRWHISLSTWFRDYVYIPLGGNRGGALRAYRNLWITFLISGFWHGASWRFVVWGAIHALALCLQRGLESSTLYRRLVPAFVKCAGVFCVVCCAWVFFRAANWADAMIVFDRVLHWEGGEFDVPILGLLWIALAWAYQAASESRVARYLEMSLVQISLATLALIYLVVISTSSGGAFIYFQF
ncbi:MAG: MBOAT family O-acyltransferase [Planctomycetota bacterium]